MLLLKNAKCVCAVFPGLTALRSDEVIDLMIKEYPSKHSEYSVILQERERQRIAKEYSVRIQKIKKKTPRVDDYFVVLCSNAFNKSPLLTCVHIFYVFFTANAAAEPSEG